MNEWCPQKKDENGNQSDTTSRDILVFNFNSRFFSQFIFLTTILTLPLIINLSWQGIT